MYDVLGLKPAPNNGTHGSLNHLLKVTAHKLAMPEEVFRPLATVWATPTLNEELGCMCDDQNKAEELNKCLSPNGTEERILEETTVVAGEHSYRKSEEGTEPELEIQRQSVQQISKEAAATPTSNHIKENGIDEHLVVPTTAKTDRNLLCGWPAVLHRTKYNILYLSDFESAYSETFMMTLRTSSTVSKQAVVSTIQEHLLNCVRLDLHISAGNSQSCSAYKADKQMSYGFLFPPQLSSSAEAKYDARLITNMIPVLPALKKNMELFSKGAGEEIFNRTQ
ncbi:hypothetical protein NDU88_002351 [Pleurodeles waltl]|uniref:Uncharacterized protein n=1 Tax=Pleurodeles waltl TaxID=8319 RepID=A0AAV7VCA9_PLEWA|nr:hypothetical protein NDU88_002351 [Pleurodeles waltl]